MEYRPTGYQTGEHLIVENGSFIHLARDGSNLGVFGAISHDTQHLKRWDFFPEGFTFSGCEQPLPDRMSFWYQNQQGGTIQRDLQLIDGWNIHERTFFQNPTDEPMTIIVNGGCETDFRGIFEVREDAIAFANSGEAALAGKEFKRNIYRQGNEEGEQIASYTREDNKETIYTRIGAPTLTSAPAGCRVENTSNNEGNYRFEITLPPHQSLVMDRYVEMFGGPSLHESVAILPDYEAWRTEFGIPFDWQEQPDNWRPLVQAADDLRSMMIATPHGITFGAGLPRFLAPFGRDQLLTALKIMPDAPNQYWRTEAVKGILRDLALGQSTEIRNYINAQGQVFPLATPDEIRHEKRCDEQNGLGMQRPNAENQEAIQRLGVRPFGAYFGTVDTTPLFVMVAGEYLKATGDTAFIQKILPSLRNALRWMQGYYATPDRIPTKNITADADYGISPDDSFITYPALPAYIAGGPLAHKGWKDKEDCIVTGDGISVTRKDGSPQDAYVGLIEVQAYAVKAYENAAYMFRQLGINEADIANLESRAEAVKARINQELVIEHPQKAGKYIVAQGIYYDGDDTRFRQPKVIDAVTSNPAHALITGVFTTENLDYILDSLEDSKELWSGWYWRTLSAANPGYLPDSYHQGSAWPHEPIVEGLCGYIQHYRETGENKTVEGKRREQRMVTLVDKATRGVYESTRFFPGNHVPELITGNPRLVYGQEQAPEMPSEACVIQTWASAALLKMEALRKEIGLPSLTEQRVPERMVA
jgi:glycogen debranching enzyme